MHARVLEVLKHQEQEHVISATKAVVTRALEVLNCANDCVNVVLDKPNLIHNYVLKAFEQSQSPYDIRDMAELTLELMRTNFSTGLGTALFCLKENDQE